MYVRYRSDLHVSDLLLLVGSYEYEYGSDYRDSASPQPYYGTVRYCCSEYTVNRILIPHVNV